MARVSLTAPFWHAPTMRDESSVAWVEDCRRGSSGRRDSWSSPFISAIARMARKIALSSIASSILRSGNASASPDPPSVGARAARSAAHSNRSMMYPPSRKGKSGCQVLK